VEGGGKEGGRGGEGAGHDGRGGGREGEGGGGGGGGGGGRGGGGGGGGEGGREGEIEIDDRKHTLSFSARLLGFGSPKITMAKQSLYTRKLNLSTNTFQIRYKLSSARV